MKDYLKSVSFKMFLSTVFVVIVLSVFSNSMSSNILSSAINKTTYGLSVVTAAASSDDELSPSQLKAENERLKKENAKLRSQLVNYYDTLSENARLWKFYDLKKTNPQYSLVPSVVLRRDANSEFYSFTLDKGSSSAISERSYRLGIRSRP